MWPSTSCPLSSLTRNIVFGRASVISPSISIFSSLAMRPEAYSTAASGPFSETAAGEIGQRRLAIGHLAGILRRLYVGHRFAKLGARLELERGGDLVAAQERRR